MKEVKDWIGGIRQRSNLSPFGVDILMRVLVTDGSAKIDRTGSRLG